MPSRSGKTNNSTADLGFEAKLWLAADKLRSNMDAAEYKHVVLGLIFLKYISDAFEEHHATLLAGKGEYAGADPEDPDEYKALNVFWVPPGCLRHLRSRAGVLHGGVIGWRPPWEPGAVQFPPGMPAGIRHVFQEELRGETLDLNRLSGAFEAIADERINDYREALPPEWMVDAASVDRIIDYIRALKENLPMAINQLQGALL